MKGRIIVATKEGFEYHVLVRSPQHLNTKVVRGGKGLLEFTDVRPVNTKSGVPSPIWTRTVGTQSYAIRDQVLPPIPFVEKNGPGGKKIGAPGGPHYVGEVVCRYHKPSVNYIKGLVADRRADTFKLITLDIETRTVDGLMSPYCICYYDGKKG